MGLSSSKEVHRVRKMRTGISTCLRRRPESHSRTSRHCQPFQKSIPNSTNYLHYLQSPARTVRSHYSCQIQHSCNVDQSSNTTHFPPVFPEFRGLHLSTPNFRNTFSPLKFINHENQYTGQTTAHHHLQPQQHHLQTPFLREH